MFSFHKPRVYRSTEGCCICRAKSSSSRFTDSRKYEEDSMKCFDLKYPRYGEICNACVLLVKRYKRLPAGSQRHWGHVVDARAGPGTKAITKIKRNKEESSSDNSSSRSSHIQNGKSAISEKFSKIFKKSKSKKQKSNVTEERAIHKSPNKVQSKITLFKRPNSIESDDDSRENSPVPTPPQNVVQFQTQTRSSSYRSMHAKIIHTHNSAINTTATVIRKSKLKISGSSRRRKLPPQKNRVSNDLNVKFFDDAEWSKRTTCCGIVVHESAILPGAAIIDLDSFKLCQDHDRDEVRNAEKIEEKLASEKAQTSIKATLPAIVKLSLPSKESSANFNPTPVLKKHHLFYKRQSESFPQGDIATTTESTIKSKTESDSQAIITRANNNSIVENNSLESSATSKVQITVCGPTLSTAKLATIVTPLDKPMSMDTINLAGIKSSSFLHRIKSDAGKIVKHSIEKLNSAVRLKAHDLTEMRHVVKPIDKNCILSKPATTVVAKTATTSIALAVPELSPTSSSSTKFSDNSSDSGFDENVQDRKSVSPLQQENDTKLLTRPPVQTLVLASGVKVHGQQQNLVYAGNDAAAKILQSRMQQQSAITSGSNNGPILQHVSNKRLNVQPLAIDPSTTLKILPAKGQSNILSIGPYSMSGVKVRPLYNSNIALQHENGITTIVPASSLDAAKQSEALMQTNSSNTVTITPSLSSQITPLVMNANSTNYQYFKGNDITGNTHKSNANQCQMNLNNSGLNQKFILLKTNSNASFSHSYNRNN